MVWSRTEKDKQKIDYRALTFANPPNAAAFKDKRVKTFCAQKWLIFDKRVCVYIHFDWFPAKIVIIVLIQNLFNLCGLKDWRSIKKLANVQQQQQKVQSFDKWIRSHVKHILPCFQRIKSVSLEKVYHFVLKIVFFFRKLEIKKNLEIFLQNSKKFLFWTQATRWRLQTQTCFWIQEFCKQTTKSDLNSVILLFSQPSFICHCI